MSMISESVCQQLFDDPQCQKLQPVTTNTVMYDHNKAKVLRSVTIPILKDNKKHGINFKYCHMKLALSSHVNKSQNMNWS